MDVGNSPSPLQKMCRPYRLTVTECSLSRRSKPSTTHYDYSSIFEVIENFLITPKRFNPTITKLIDLSPGEPKVVMSDLFSDDDKFFDLSNIKVSI